MPYIGKEPAKVPVTAADIPDNSITAAKIVDGAITIADIADDAVTEAKLANAINSAIAANTAKTGITTAQADAITANTAKTGITSGQASAITANTAKVTNATHTGDVTGSGALTIATDAVTTTKILDGAITAAKINSAVALGGPSLGTDSVIRTNAQTISENITIGSTTNGMSAGPITIADTYTVTVNGN